jgi:hypothetical protein
MQLVDYNLHLSKEKSENEHEKVYSYMCFSGVNAFVLYNPYVPHIHEGASEDNGETDKNLI